MTDAENPSLTEYILLEEEAFEDPHLQDAIGKLKLHSIYSKDIDRYTQQPVKDCTFILTKFEGALFNAITANKGRIIGVPLLLYCAQNMWEKIPRSRHPLFSQTMSNLVIAFSGFTDEVRINQLGSLVHSMGASIRKDMGVRVTHLISVTTASTKYRSAVARDLPVLKPEWVELCWKHAGDLDFNPADEKVINENRLPPFHGCVLSFLNFPADDDKNMRELAETYGGVVCEVDDSSCTHVVVGDNTKVIPRDALGNQHADVVKSDWFWYSIQLMYCASESLYEFEAPGTPSYHRTLRKSASRSRKRRQRESIEMLAADDSPDMYRSRGSPSSAIALDATPESPIAAPTKRKAPLAPSATAGVAAWTKRHHVAMELLQTESNYFGVLQTVITVFKEGIENPSQPGGPILGAQDVRQIFGEIPAIYEVHRQTQDQLSLLLNDWREDCSIGKVFLEHAEELQKRYPPFVNFFENTKETIERCERAFPRFQAFLKVCLSKPECGRQSLAELLIRPVQRLPSTSLLLSDLLKHTPSSNPDHVELERALDTLKMIMTHINEDKRKTESQITMFDTINDIENVPPTLLSSGRTFLEKVDVLLLSSNIAQKGDQLTVFLFSDSVEICKRRSVQKGISPALKSKQKAFKHIQLFPLRSVRRVINIEETEDISCAFAVFVRQATEDQTGMHAFLIVDEINKSDFLLSISKQAALAASKANYGDFLISVPADTLEIEPLDPKLIALTKAAKFATKARKRVSRAFSIHTTPNKLRRAMTKSVSQLMSPFKTPHTPSKLNSVAQLPDSPLSSRNPLTPILRSARRRTLLSRTPTLYRSFRTDRSQWQISVFL